MHDTPASERDLFTKSYRGLSHGCMRVAEPLRLATILLAQDKGWSEQQVQSLLNGGTREVALTTRIPVHMTYFTAMVDRQGNRRPSAISMVSMRAWAPSSSARKSRSSRRATTMR